MARSTVIADAGQTLVQLLQEEMDEDIIPQPEQIGLGHPADQTDYRLSLYLYNIRESGEFRHTQMVTRGSDQLQHPPMTVELLFLMTAKSSAEVAYRAIDEAQILGRAMQILYDHSIIRGSRLLGSLGEVNEEVRVKLDNIPRDIMTRIWSFPNVPYRLSIGYSVGPVYIDSTRIKTTKRVLEREMSIEEDDK